MEKRAPATHKHFLAIETDESFDVSIDRKKGSVPGGWHRGFNRVYSWFYFAHLSPAAKAIYKILEFQSQWGDEHSVKGMSYAQIAELSGLSRDSVRKQFVELETLDLVHVRAESDWRTWTPKEFQLAVPVKEYAAYLSRLPFEKKAKLFRGGGPFYPHVGGVRTPSQGVTDHPEPGCGSTLDRGLPLTGGRGMETLSVKNIEEKNSNTDVAVLLIQSGVDAAVAASLAHKYERERIVEVIATMEWRRARGKCSNPGGFIRDALVKVWQTPKPVMEILNAAKARDAARQQLFASDRRASSVASEDDQAVDAAINKLDDDDLAIFVQSVLTKYEGNTTVTKVLSSKPPRHCRLMKMEIAAMLRPSAPPAPPR